MLNLSDILALLPQAFGETNLPLPNKQSGKVRDWYSLPNGQRLLVTTDRLSAFDQILARVPYKGQVLNQLAWWWFEQTKDIVANHAISMPDPNALIAHELTALPIEVVVRGFISGVTSTSLWRRYELGERNIYGHTFPDGLVKNQALPKAIITPTTKGSASGHDERITTKEIIETKLVSEKDWAEIERAALDLFARGQELAIKAGLVLVDTKYEFGRDHNDQIVLIDEIHTPDSSRYWKKDSYQTRIENNQEPENFDKEFVRLEYAALGYRGDGTPPTMPAELWCTTSLRYIQIFEQLTGQTFVPAEYPVRTRLENNLRLAKII